MSGELIGALRVALGIDTAKFDEGLKRSRARAEADATAIQKSLDGAKTALTGFTVLLGGSALIAAGKKALDYASSLAEVAQQLGVTTKELQEYRYAGSQVGIANDEMDKSLARLTRTIGEAKAGSKEQANVFRELGVSVQDANGRVYSAGEVIPKLADALSKIKDPATRARLEVELFGKAGQKLDTLLSGGSAAVNQLRDAAQKLGVVLSDSQIQNADDTADKLAALKQVLEARIAGVVADNAKSILSLAEAIATLTSRAEAFIAKHPALTGALAGTALGARAGLPGAAAGGVLGFIGGDQARQASENSNMDVGFRSKKLKEAMDRVNALQNAQKSGSLLTVRRSGGGGGWTLETALAEVRRQTGLTQQALSARQGATGPASAIVPDGALPVAKGTKAKGPTAADRAQNYAEELLKLQRERLDLEQSITSDAREQAGLEHDRISAEQKLYDAQLEDDVRHRKLTEADAVQLKLKNDRNVQLQHTAVNWRLDDELTQQELAAHRESLQTQTDLLQEQSRMARTASERRDIELKILDNQIAMEKATLEAVKAMHSSTPEEKANAQARLDALPALRSASAANIQKSNMGPLAAYFDSLPRNAAEVNEAFENIAANGIANMVDGLAQAGANVLQLKGLAGQLFNQLIADTIRLNLQSKLAGGGGILGALGSLFGIASRSNFAATTIAENTAWIGTFKPPSPIPGIGNLPGFAGGGSFTVNGNSGIDTNVLALNGVPVARVNTGERITVDPQAVNDNRATRVQIVPSPYFDAVVDQRAGKVAAPVGLAATTGGATLAAQSAARRRARAIPSSF